MGISNVHVRPAEVAAQLAVDLTKGVISVRTFHSRDDKGFSLKVPVVDAMWTTADVAPPTVVVVLDNGQEFEMEVRYSSPEMRAARLAVEHPAGKAERAQNEANAAARAGRKV